MFKWIQNILNAGEELKGTEPNIEDRFKDIGQPVQAIVEAMESRPKTFKFTHILTSGPYADKEVASGLDKITGVYIKRTKMSSEQRNRGLLPYSIKSESPFKPTAKEWQLLIRTAKKIGEERKERYNKIRRERVYRKYR